VEGGQSVVAIGIERSPRAPHRLRAYDSSDFWLRTMRSVEKMDVDQIRESFRRGFMTLSEADDRLTASETRTQQVRPSEPFFWSAITPTYPTPFSYPPRDPRLRPLLTNMLSFRSDISSCDVGFDVHGAFLFSGGIEGRRMPLFRIHPDGTL